jgi:hypothetical protein
MVRLRQSSSTECEALRASSHGLGYIRGVKNKSRKDVYRCNKGNDVQAYQTILDVEISSPRNDIYHRSYPGNVG